MGTLVMIAQLILSLSILVTLHEMGHYLPAKWFKTRVEKFYLFFDPWFSLIKAKKMDGKWNVKFGTQEFPDNDDKSITEYGIGWVPFGGYVKIAGMVDESFDTEALKEEPKEWEFRSKPAWQRLIVMLGGVTVNFILGFFLFSMILFVWGKDYIPAKNVSYGIVVDSLGIELGLQNGDKIIKIGDEALEEFNMGTLRTSIAIHGAKTITVERNGAEQTLTVPQGMGAVLSSYDSRDKFIAQPRIPFVIDTILPDKPAAAAMLLKEDKVIGLGGTTISYFDEFSALSAKMKGQATQITVERNGSPMTLPITLSEDGKIGVGSKPYDSFFELGHKEYGFAESIPAGIKGGSEFLGGQIKAFGKMFTGEIKAKDSLGSVISIGRTFGNTWDWRRFWQLTAFFSLILGFINLLPIPALDGGHVIFLLYEMLTGRPPSDRFLEIANMIGFVLLISLMVFALGLDISRLF